MKIVNFDYKTLESFIGGLTKDSQGIVAQIIDNDSVKNLKLECFTDFCVDYEVERILVWNDENNLYLISVLCAGQASQIGVLNLDSFSWLFKLHDEIEYTNLIFDANKCNFYAAGHYYSYAQPQEFMCSKIRLTDGQLQIISMKQKDKVRIDSLEGLEATLILKPYSDMIVYTFGKESMTYK